MWGSSRGGDGVENAGAESLTHHSASNPAEKTNPSSSLRCSSLVQIMKLEPIKSIAMIGLGHIDNACKQERDELTFDTSRTQL